MEVREEREKKECVEGGILRAVCCYLISGLELGNLFGAQRTDSALGDRIAESLR